MTISLDDIKNIAFIVGIPVSVYKFWVSKTQEKTHREYNIYDVVDKKYIEFQNLCFQYPRLDIGPTPNAIKNDLTAEEKKQEMLSFTVLLSLFERTYIMYAKQKSGLRDKQWVGWDLYIREYAKRDNFKQAWKLYGYSYDGEFQEYLNKLVRAMSNEE